MTETESFTDWVRYNRNQILLDLSAGTISGIVHCVAAHPFDTIKVRMQVSTESLLAVTFGIAKKEGILAYFKGMEFPLVAVPAVNACVFTTYEFCKRLLGSKPNQPNQYWKIAVCGMFTGSATSFLTTPIELAKCQLQTQVIKRYDGPFDCMKQIFRQEGLRGIFRGMFITQYREITGFGSYFLTYEISKDLFKWIKKSEDSNSIDLLTAGGIAGVVSWTVSYPQDTIKTILQSELSQSRIYKTHRYIPDGGYLGCHRQLVKQEGWQGLWKGYSACMIRAFYSNAIVFYAYEIAKDLLQKNFVQH